MDIRVALLPPLGVRGRSSSKRGKIAELKSGPVRQSQYKAGIQSARIINSSSSSSVCIGISVNVSINAIVVISISVGIDLGIGIGVGIIIVTILSVF